MEPPSKSTGAPATEAVVRGFLEAAPDAIVIVDRQGKIVIVNSQTERLFGFPREELIGQSVEILVPARFRGVHPGYRGLGLAIVRHLVELHGGTVTVDSPGEGRGATFTIELPVGRQTHGARSAMAVTPHVDLTGLRILVVDDQADERELLTAILERHDASVSTADSARAALRAIAGRRPDVLISDIAMPDADGYTVLQRVRNPGPDTAGLPAIAVTAHARVEDRERALAAGFQAYIAKPIDRTKLLEAIAAAVTRPGRRGS